MNMEKRNGILQMRGVLRDEAPNLAFNNATDIWFDVNADEARLTGHSFYNINTPTGRYINDVIAEANEIPHMTPEQAAREPEFKRDYSRIFDDPEKLREMTQRFVSAVNNKKKYDGNVYLDFILGANIMTVLSQDEGLRQAVVHSLFNNNVIDPNEFGLEGMDIDSAKKAVDERINIAVDTATVSGSPRCIEDFEAMRFYDSEIEAYGSAIVGATYQAKGFLSTLGKLGYGVGGPEALNILRQATGWELEDTTYKELQELRDKDKYLAPHEYANFQGFKKYAKLKGIPDWDVLDEKLTDWQLLVRKTATQDYIKEMIRLGYTPGPIDPVTGRPEELKIHRDFNTGQAIFELTFDEWNQYYSPTLVQYDENGRPYKLSQDGLMKVYYVDDSLNTPSKPNTPYGVNNPYYNTNGGNEMNNQFNQPTGYGQPQAPAYGQPQAPVNQAPTYNQYGQPAYGQPQAPVNQAPAYGQPQAPTYNQYGQPQAPTYGRPRNVGNETPVDHLTSRMPSVFDKPQAPVNQAPVYGQPQAPVNQAPAYGQPSPYTQMQYDAYGRPVAQAPVQPQVQYDAYGRPVYQEPVDVLNNPAYDNLSAGELMRIAVEEGRRKQFGATPYGHSLNGRVNVVSPTEIGTGGFGSNLVRTTPKSKFAAPAFPGMRR